ncbi:NADH-quinone oxidoreductase subunit N [Calderihabitans maritimus]|uniref:NADH-quinone oxidoreductase subunit N n=1 Tax=Calderihabitans maritimus TaxID=1246530 RepID=A0A1Z5HTW3_9FIRM|nr:NADH-quinone oxidoreductase subunit N [Calderihabitans maritimus]GAW92858.1 proton-translocating NADH-quinone oxidoreductase, chain N [Calderihabitans maritimus]
MNFTLLTVEILTALLATGLLVLGLLVPKNQNRGVGYLTTLGLLAILAVTFVFRNVNATLFNGMYIVDPFATFFKQLFLVAAILVSIASLDFVQKLGYNQGEFFSLLVYATLGMMIMASAGDLITLYIGLELMTISFCILACYKKKDAKSAEAGIKYIILGAMSSAILLYGLSLIFGLTQTTVIGDIAAVVTEHVQPLLLIGVIFLVAGFGFKISAVPFHMWSPDIYEGAPTPVTAFLAVASKAAGFAVFLRVFMQAIPTTQPYWLLLLMVLATLTMLLGNFVAIPQTNIKRLLAYSSIAQAGYLLLGLIAFSSLGVAAILFHSILYVFSNLGAFMVAIAFSNATGSDEIKDYAGLSRRSPLLAVVMLLSLLSLAGIPPLAGFQTKFYLFTSIIDKGYLWLAFVGIGTSMVSVYYYLIVGKVMYLGEPPADSKPIHVPLGLQAALLISMAATIFFGIYPTPLLNAALNVAQVFFPH